VGKTTLAVHWAHRVSGRFPDGQLYVNLKGFDPGGDALDPGEAARGFLEAFGVPVTRIPADLTGQVGLYRSLLAGRRVLVVLDNARDAGQVRPLLPGSPGCLALVTSRNHLTGLVASEGAHPLALDLLPAADARDLLTRRLGSGRLAREPAAVDDIIDRCARLPAASLIEPNFEPPALMSPQSGVSPGEPGTAAEAMSWFQAEHAVLPGVVQLAADAGHSGSAWRLAWMLSPFFILRGSWSDNSRAQQAALAAVRRDGDAAGEAHALHGLALGHARSGRFRDARPHFQCALRQFEATGDRVGQARIHDSLAWLSEREERPADSLSHATRALELFRAAGHLPGQAMALNSIGFCHALLGDYQQAIASCEQALDANRAAGERNGEAATWDSLGYIRHQIGEHERAVADYQRAVGLYRELADRFNEADTPGHLGDVQLSAGNPEAARRTWEHALRIFDEIDHPDGDQIRAKLRAGVTPGALQALAAGLADCHVDRRAQPGHRAGGRGLRLHHADELAGEVYDEGDPAEGEARRLQRGGCLRLGVIDHARDGGRVVPANGQAALVAERHLSHVAQVADPGRDELMHRVRADAQVEIVVVAPGEQ
jgi:tetratricopeptide (TPR) repeat protein